MQEQLYAGVSSGRGEMQHLQSSTVRTAQMTCLNWGTMTVLSVEGMDAVDPGPPVSGLYRKLKPADSSTWPLQNARLKAGDARVYLAASTALHSWKATEEKRKVLPQAVEGRSNAGRTCAAFDR